MTQSYDIDLWRAIILLCITMICIVFVIKRANTGIERMYFVFSILGITVYSGISTIMIGLCDEFFVPYIIFLVLFTACFGFAVSRNNVKRKNQSTKTINKGMIVSDGSASYYIPRLFLRISVFFFFSYYIILLVYPKVRISQLFHPSLDIANIFQRRSDLRGNYVYQIFYYLNLSSTTLVFVYANKCYRNGNWRFPVLVFGLWFYCQLVVLGYMSRNEMLIVAVFLILIIHNRNNKEISISTRLIVIGMVGVLLLVPFLNSFELIRMGVSVGKTGFFESFRSLFMKETTYGQYYAFCANYSNGSLIFKYFVWLITLPLPSALFGSIKEYGLATNTVFTVAYTGIKEGSKNYSVILPSVFGEALMIYGKYFFWIHAVFLGLFFGFFCKRMEKNEDLSLLNLYFAVSLFLLGRGGSEAVIAIMLNYMFIFWIVKQMLRIRRVPLPRES